MPARTNLEGAVLAGFIGAVVFVLLVVAIEPAIATRALALAMAFAIALASLTAIVVIDRSRLWAAMWLLMLALWAFMVMYDPLTVSV